MSSSAKFRVADVRRAVVAYSEWAKQYVERERERMIAEEVAKKRFFRTLFRLPPITREEAIEILESEFLSDYTMLGYPCAMDDAVEHVKFLTRADPADGLVTLEWCAAKGLTPWLPGGNRHHEVCDAVE